MYRTLVSRNVGMFLNSTKNTPGRYAMEAIARHFDAIKDQIGGTVNWIRDSGSAIRYMSVRWTSQRCASGRSPGLPSGLTPL
jgi:hypothetical protein